MNHIIPVRHPEHPGRMITASIAPMQTEETHNQLTSLSSR